VLQLLIAAAVAATPYSDARPPVTLQQNRTVTVEFAGQGRINSVCHSLFGAPPAGMKTNACATGQRLMLPNPCAFGPSDRYAALLCHELGHANGWPSTHGDFPVAARAGVDAPSS
jgi:hypothetical protein